MATASERLVGGETFQETLNATDVQTQDATVRDQQISNVFFSFLARFLGFGALLGSLLLTLWGWFRLL